MINIVPSVLTDQEDSLIKQCNALKPFFPQVQIDICDGHFTQNKTVGLSSLNKITDTKIKLGIHLMVNDWQSCLGQLESSQITNIVVHQEASGNVQEALSWAEKNHKQIGLAFNPETDPLDNLNLINQMDFIQLMGVTPGAQNRPFQPQVLMKILRLRQNGYNKPIWLDGGVNEETISAMKKFSPDVLVVGSYFSQANNLEQNLNKLRSLL